MYVYDLRCSLRTCYREDFGTKIILGHCLVFACLLPVFSKHEPIFCTILEKLPVRLNSHTSLGELRITHFFGFFLRTGLSSMLLSLVLSCYDGLKLHSDGTLTYINNLYLFYTCLSLCVILAERNFTSTTIFFSSPFILMHFILLLLGGCAMLIQLSPFRMSF